MRALVFEPTIPRFVATKVLGRVDRAMLWGRFSPLHYREVSDPSLPGREWVRIATRLGGICGTDLHTIHLDASPALSALTSFPFVLGHENVGTIVELGRPGDGLALGQRVTAEPVLPCAARGIATPCENCRAGNYNLCLRTTEGDISPGLMIGGCRDTGGSWGTTFVAHRSQVFPVPEAVTDENALMVEPMAITLHPLLRHPPHPGGTVLIIGGGVIGQCAVATLRAMGSTARVVMLAKYAFQGTKATQLGANQWIPVRSNDSHVEAIADLTGGTLRRPLLGKRVLIGGVDLTVDCVGSSRSLDDALRFTRPGGTVLVVGLATFPRGIDWTPLWLKELNVVGSSFYSWEDWQGRRVRTMDIVLDWMARGVIDLGPLVTHRFLLASYAEALGTAMGKRQSAAFKVAFLGERSS